MPIHEDFVSSGVVAALRRQERWVNLQFPNLLASANMGPSLCDCSATVPTDVTAALRSMRTFRRARVVLDSVLTEAALPPLQKDPDVDAADIDPVMLMNMTRMSYGDMLESSARLRASRHCSCDELPPNPIGIRRSNNVFARLMVDSYLIACWTSAHAEWMSLRADADRLARSVSIRADTLSVPNASISLVPYAVTTLPDLGGLFERRVPCKTASKSAVAMTALLNRCTNAGSRGWDSTLNEALSDSDGCTKIMFNVMAATCTGMHTMVHPGNRPCWEERMRIHRLMCTLDVKTLLADSGSASKETARMYTAVILSNMPATREAMLAAGHPAGHLVVSPFEPPPVALVAAMTQILRAAKRLCGQPNMPNAKWFAHDLLASLNDENKKRKGSSKSKASTVPIVYTNSWLGRSQPLCVKGQRLIEAASSVFFQSFKSEFLPMWYYESTRGHRVSRLDRAQHRELHMNNPALMLCRELPDAESLRIQSLALRDKRFGIMTLSQAASLLGITKSNASGKGCCEITELSAEEAAKILTLARVSSGAAHLVAYNLGANTRRMQVDAVCARLMQPRKPEETDEEAIARLPNTATHMMLCVECRRVANACQNGSGKDVTFNELGIRSSMLRVEGDLKDGHMRCAKRSSAALRTALQLEEDSRCASEKQQNSTSIVQFDTNGMVSRLRRDVKAVYDQVGAAKACGDQPLVCVPVVGRVISVFNQFYALCSYCGGLCNVEQSNRYGSEICCMRCDFKMLHRDKPPPIVPTTDCIPVKCRYCGREDLKTANGNRFKMVAAPHDAVGHNESLPRPLRWVAFCNAHWRPWLGSALDVMNMREVFSHISSRCRPIFAAAGGQKAIEYTGGDSNETALVASTASKTRTKSVARMLRKGASGRKTISKKVRNGTS